MKPPASPPTAIGLVPARSGSARVPDKNIRRLAGHPLLAYAIASARESGIFDSVLVSTDDEHYADIARHYGAEVPFLRPREMATATSPDVEWIRFTLDRLKEQGRRYDCFSILRPTSPFRRAETIRRAWRQFLSEEGVDSLRAIEKCREHPGKMWVVRGQRMLPLMPLSPAEQPWHSTQYAALPEVYVQNASLEIAWCRLIDSGANIAGTVLMPFLTEGHEGTDINDGEDWWYVQHLLDTGAACLPPVPAPPYPAD